MNISPNSYSKTVTFENDNGIICYKIDGKKYNTLEEIPDSNDREQARRWWKVNQGLLKKRKRRRIRKRRELKEEGE